VLDGQAAAVVPSMAAATSGTTARERSFMVASFLRDRVSEQEFMDAGA
jgi:hypothetical protein